MVPGTVKRAISMIVNPLFSKSGKRFNSILKNQTEKPNTNVAQFCGCTQETWTSNLFEGLEIFFDLDVCLSDVSKSQ